MGAVVLSLCVCLLFFSGLVQATPIFFDFSTSGVDYTYHDAGLTLLVSAEADGTFVPDYLKITQTNSGLGVYSKEGDDPQLENSGPDDSLVFDFSQRVNLQQVVFGLVGAADEFKLSVDTFAVLGATKIWADQTVALIDDFCSYYFDLVGSSFEFTTNDSLDKFRIKSLTVDYAPVPTPEPST